MKTTSFSPLFYMGIFMIISTLGFSIYKGDKFFDIEYFDFTYIEAFCLGLIPISMDKYIQSICSEYFLKFLSIFIFGICSLYLVFAFSDKLDVFYSYLPLPNIEVVSINGTINDDFSGNFPNGSTLTLEEFKFSRTYETYARVSLNEYPCIIFNLPFKSDMRDKVINFKGEKVLKNNSSAKLKIRKSDFEKLISGSENHDKYTHIKFYSLALEDEILIEKYNLK